MTGNSNLKPMHAEEAFDAEWYLNEYPDVARSGLSPAEHYNSVGRLLGRAPSPVSGLDVRHVVAKKTRFSTCDEVALFVTHAPGGRLKPHGLPYMKLLKGTGLLVMLVVVADRPLELLEEEVATADGIIVRDNAGYDFGAWAHAFKLCPTLFDTRLLIMTNDSVIPTADPTVFAAMMNRIRANEADISGLTANHERGWHLQSYFLAITHRALRTQAFQDFIRKIRRIDDKDEVISAYEIPFAAQMQGAGLTVDALYHGPYPNNPVIWSWRELVEGGFPFIKLLLLRKVMSTYTEDAEMLKDLHENWPTVLAAAGFDVRLVRLAVRAAELDPIQKGMGGGLIQNPDKFRRLTNAARVAA